MNRDEDGHGQQQHATAVTTEALRKVRTADKPDRPSERNVASLGLPHAFSRHNERSASGTRAAHGSAEVQIMNRLFLILSSLLAIGGCSSATEEESESSEDSALTATDPAEAPKPSWTGTFRLVDDVRANVLIVRQGSDGRYTLDLTATERRTYRQKKIGGVLLSNKDATGAVESLGYGLGEGCVFRLRLVATNTVQVEQDVPGSCGEIALDGAYARSATDGSCPLKMHRCNSTCCWD
jgi:hypothetical protein